MATESGHKTFEVVQANLNYRGSRPYSVDYGTADVVRVATVYTSTWPRRLALAQAFETDACPAFDWELKNNPEWRND